MAMDKDHRIKLIKDGYMDKQGGETVYAAFGLWAISLFLCTFFASTGISTQTGMIFFTISSLTFGPLLAFLCLRWMKMMVLML